MKSGVMKKYELEHRKNLKRSGNLWLFLTIKILTQRIKSMLFKTELLYIQMAVCWVLDERNQAGGYGERRNCVSCVRMYQYFLKQFCEVSDSQEFDGRVFKTDSIIKYSCKSWKLSIDILLEGSKPVNKEKLEFEFGYESKVIVRSEFSDNQEIWDWEENWKSLHLVLRHNFETYDWDHAELN